MHHQLVPSVGKIIFVFCSLSFSDKRLHGSNKIKSHQESRDASSNPHRDRQSALVTQPPSIQHVQSMAAAMAELTRQNQELTREINLRR